MTYLALIAAVAENGVIGRDNDLPWRLPGDMRYFKQVTMGKPVVMGRKTYDSIGRPLPGRTNIVITRNAGFAAEGVEVYVSLEAALGRARAVAEADGVGEVIIMGGAEIYRASLPFADRLYITEVHAQVEGDTRLEIDWNQWRETAREHHPPEPPGAELGYSFVRYERAGAQTTTN